MGRVERSIEIEAPLEKVFAFYADPKNAEALLPEDADAKVEKIAYERCPAVYCLTGNVTVETEVTKL